MRSLQGDGIGRSCPQEEDGDRKSNKRRPKRGSNPQVPSKFILVVVEISIRSLSGVSEHFQSDLERLKERSIRNPVRVVLGQGTPIERRERLRESAGAATGESRAAQELWTEECLAR
jgi:hypothetical protein